MATTTGTATIKEGMGMEEATMAVTTMTPTSKATITMAIRIMPTETQQPKMPGTAAPA